MIRNNTKQASKVHTCRDGSKDFETTYDNACALSGTYPLKSVKAFLDDGILDINGDRINPEDWPSICKALRGKHNLKFIAVRSFWRSKLIGKTNASTKPTNKPPCIQTPIIINELVASLAASMMGTQFLTCIELQNVPLRLPEITILSKSLSQNHMLQHLSLCQCLIGDDGLEVICKSVRNCFNITSANFSCCGITWRGAQILVSLLQHQIIHRHSEAWKETLRHAIVNLDTMGGLQRLTINGNPLIGDKGAHIIADILQEDLWLKAIDIQNCGIQESGARALLSALKYNTTLYILDIRKNVIRDHDLLLRISQQLYFNNQGQTSQFKWLNNSTKTKKSVPQGGRNVSRKSNGIPWRVAERFNSTRHYHSRIPGIANVFYQSHPSLLRDSSDDKSDTISNSSKRTADIKGTKRDVLNTVKKELNLLRKQIHDERATRKEAESRILELTAENEKLRENLAKMSLTSLDDNTLDAIDATFMKFNAFIEVLQRIGYGKLTNAGIMKPSDEESQKKLSLNATNNKVNNSETTGRYKGVQINGRTEFEREESLLSVSSKEKQQPLTASISENTSVDSLISGLNSELHTSVKNECSRTENSFKKQVTASKRENDSKSSHSNYNASDSHQNSLGDLDQLAIHSLNSSSDKPRTDNVNSASSKNSSSSSILAQSSNISTPETLSGILSALDKF